MVSRIGGKCTGVKGGEEELERDKPQYPRPEKDGRMDENKQREREGDRRWERDSLI